MTLNTPLALACAALFSATAAHADIAVRFDEGAPKDRFTFANTGDCALPSGQITLDLGQALAGLVFDVTSAGAGVEVFQPFDLIAGQTNLRAQPVVKDGDAVIVMDINGLGAGEAIAFTIDVDDTGGGREITVSGSEIAGAAVSWSTTAAQTTATFTDNARATVPTGPCAS